MPRTLPHTPPPRTSAAPRRVGSLLGLCSLLLLGGCDLGGLVLPQGSAPRAVGGVSQNDLESYGSLLRVLARLIPAHEAPLLKPLTTNRMAASMDQAVARNGGRFWRHLDHLSAGLKGGFTLETPQRRPDGRIALPLKFSGGGSATLLVVEEDGQPRIDRF